MKNICERLVLFVLEVTFSGIPEKWDPGPIRETWDPLTGTRDPGPIRGIRDLYVGPGTWDPPPGTRDLGPYRWDPIQGANTWGQSKKTHFVYQSTHCFNFKL